MTGNEGEDDDHTSEGGLDLELLRAVARLPVVALPPKPGTQVNDRLRLVRPLGRGGMGQVWTAFHAALDTEVAVKFISRELGHNGELRARFEREARTAARIKSPHVVTMLDQGVMSDGTPYLVMELLAGESLAERIKSQGALAPAEVDDVLEQVARALTAAHELGIVHRDIKPSNIHLVRASGARLVKVLDFGIARIADGSGTALTRPSTMMGTPMYMSPEQLHDASTVGESADLWALAVTAYEALIGKVPFSGPSAVAVWTAIQVGAYEPPSRARESLPVELDAWFRRAFAQGAAERFPSARAMIDAFHACLQGRDGTPSVPHDAQTGPPPKAPSSLAHAPAVAARPGPGPSPGPIAAGASPDDSPDGWMHWFLVAVLTLVLAGLCLLYVMRIAG